MQATNEFHRNLSKSAIVRHNVHMVEQVARRVHRRTPNNPVIEYDDLVSVGMLGLLEAREKYEATGDVAFASYAEFRVRGAMLDELRQRDFFPRRLRAKANRLRKATAKLTNDLGREPTEEELGAELELSVDKLRSLKDAVQPYRFVDPENLSAIGSERPSPHTLVTDKELRDHLVEALEALPERHGKVLELVYLKGLRQSEVAELLGLTDGRISQIKSEALKLAARELQRIRGAEAAG